MIIMTQQEEPAKVAGSVLASRRCIGCCDGGCIGATSVVVAVVKVLVPALGERGGTGVEAAAAAAASVVVVNDIVTA